VLGHVFVVTVVISSFPGTLESLDNVLAPEEDAVKDESTDLCASLAFSTVKVESMTYSSVGHEHGVGKGTSQLGKPKLQQA
jgi:hypothetical protein